MPNPMPATTGPAAEYLDTARDCAGLLTLLRQALDEHVGSHRAGAGWAEVSDLFAFRHRLYETLIPTRGLPTDGAALAEIDRLLPQVRPDNL